MKPRVGLLCAVEQEAAPVLAELRRVQSVALGPGTFYSGFLGEVGVLLVISGVGKVNAAQALTLAMARRPIWAAVSFGIGGAYPGAGARLGRIAIATEEVYGDEGLETYAGFRGVAGLALPPGARLRQRYPADERLVTLLGEAARGAGHEPVAGPFVTVSTCTGTEERAGLLRRRFAAVCENMEGAAIAQVAHAYRIPFGAVRGISNRVGRRDRNAWKVTGALEAAGAAVAGFLRLVPGGR